MRQMRDLFVPGHQFGARGVHVLTRFIEAVGGLLHLVLEQYSMYWLK